MFEWLLRALFPGRCILCHSLLPLKQEIEMCEVCCTKNILEKPMFITWGRQSYKVISAFRYDGIVREMLHRFKYIGKCRYSRTLGILLGNQVKKMTKDDEFDIIISVPLHPNRAKIRGYNQSELLSQQLARALQKTDCSIVLRRTRDTAFQNQLSREKRFENMCGAFHVAVPSKVLGRHVLLVDDILTTGSTLCECGRVLMAAGAASLRICVVATGRKETVY